jgi:succinate dehydrogenase / fumarate reductase flavoprotein subunit
LLNMEFVQFHPTGMVWPPSVKGILVTESVRGDGGVLRNSEGKRFMFDYVPSVFRGQYAETEDEADRWYTDPDHNKRPPELLPRDEVARAINSEVKGADRRTAGCSSTSRADAPRPRSSSACRRCTTSSRSWPTSTSPRSPWRSGRLVTT